MKTIKGVLTLVLVAGMSSAGFAQDYDGAESRIFLGRTPLGTQQSLDSDIRLRSMGGLDLAVRDESSELGVYKYGGSPAGLPLDYDRKKVELGILGEAGVVEDKNSIQTTYVGDKSDVTIAAPQGMLAIPFRAGANGKGTALFGFVSEAGENEYTSGGANALGYNSVKDEPSASNIQFGYGHQIHKFIFGLLLEGTNFEIANIEINNGGSLLDVVFERDISDFFPSFGYIFGSRENHQLTLVAGPSFRHLENTIESTSSSSKIVRDQDGTIFRGGVHYQNGSMLKAGIFVEGGEVSGDHEQVISGTRSLFDADTDQSKFKGRLYAEPEAIPFSFGFEVKSESEGTKVMNGGTVVGDTEETSSEVGLGATWHIGEDKGLVGLQVTSFSDEDEDNLNTNDSDTNETRDGSEVSLGGEWNVNDPLSLRAGVRLRQFDEEPKNSPAISVKTREFNLGGEYRWADRFSLSGKFTMTIVDSDSVDAVAAAGDFDDLTYRGTSLQLVGKLYWGDTIE